MLIFGPSAQRGGPFCFIVGANMWSTRRPTTEMKAFRNLRTIGALLLLVMVIGTAGYHFLEGWSWFDGFYMVVTTLTTIGYQEVHPLSACRTRFQCLCDCFRRLAALLGVGALSQALLEFELQSFFGRRRMEREISG